MSDEADSFAGYAPLEKETAPKKQGILNQSPAQPLPSGPTVNVADVRKSKVRLPRPPHGFPRRA